MSPKPSSSAFFAARARLILLLADLGVDFELLLVEQRVAFGDIELLPVDLDRVQLLLEELEYRFPITCLLCD